MISDENVQRYARGLYPIAALLITVPLADLVLRTSPPQFGTLQWRFATVGLLLGNMGTILLGVALTGLFAAIAGHRRVLRGIGFAALALAVVLLAVLVLFTLDAIQIRRLANQNFKRPVLLSSIGAMFTALMAILSLLGIGRAGVVASRAKRAPERRPKAASPIVVNRPSPAAADVAARTGATESV